MFGSTATVPSNSNITLSFNGVDGNGKELPDGNYSWILSFTDQVGQSVSQGGNVVIDNTLPLILSTTGLTTPSLPIPHYATTITISAEDTHLANGTLFYHTNDNSSWIAVLMNEFMINATNAIFTGIIPNSTSTTIYWKAGISDTAGNIQTVDDNGQPYSYSKPNLSLKQISTPVSSIDLNTQSNYTVQILVPENAEFVAYVYINYTLDNGVSWHIVNMTEISTTLYSYNFTNFADDVASLNYTVIGVDIFGNQFSLGAIYSIVIFPVMPVWNMSSTDQAVAIIVSVLAGVVCGLIYSAIVQGTPTLRQLTLAEKKRTKSDEREKTRKVAFFSSGIVTSTVTFVIIGGLLIMAIIAYSLLHQPEIAMLLFAGLFLATTFLWVLVTDAIVVNTMRSGELKVKGKFMLLILGVGFSIFITLIIIIFIGNTVTWWYVRINQAAYHLVGLTIPKMLSSLASTFFTLIIVLSWTVGSDVARTAKQLHEQELTHTNPGLLMEHREDALSRIQGSVGMKAIVFIAIIGVTIILASDLSIYVGQGLLIIVPFVLGTVAVIGINSVRRKRARKTEADIAYDHITTCPVCGIETSLGWLYCENCGAKLIGGTRILDGNDCPHCGMLNPVSVKHCRSCGEEIEEDLTSIHPKDHESEPSADNNQE